MSNVGEFLWSWFRADRTQVYKEKEKFVIAFLIRSPRNASSETQGQSVGPGEKARRKFSSTGGRAPGYLLSPDHFQTVKRILAPDWAQKMLCIIVPNRRTISPVFFSWVCTRQLFFQSRLVWLMHQIKEMHAVRRLSVWYKIPIWSRNTVYPKTKDAFPKIQAWAYNRYLRLHRSRLRKY